ncbi:hypothetical protein [Risungbinella massiliensis]|uniref:hypothetical protein n=1 Tax=Risungbinella massiliensis TaxID=1329796 RepID=UPI0005CBB214|nr:hypothetical protein [Risungbinella massiliensis]
MKTSPKGTRKITIEDHSFYYVVNENRDNVKLRVYSGEWKSSYFEVCFTYQDAWGTNFHKPGVCAALTKYAIQNGWKHTEKNQTLLVSEGSFLVEELGLEEISNQSQTAV